MLVMAALTAPANAMHAQVATPAAVANANDPEARRIASAYTTALLELRVDDAAALVHSSALTSIRRMVNLMLGDNVDPAERMQILKVRTAAEQAKLTDQQVFARFLGVVMNQQGARDVLKNSKSTALGAVAEGQTLHFVSRTEIAVEGVKMSKMEVLSMQKENGVWRVLLSGDLNGMVAALEAQSRR
jgi:hypothetical protein